jgi:hypothetical protein
MVRPREGFIREVKIDPHLPPDSRHARDVATVDGFVDGAPPDPEHLGELVGGVRTRSSAIETAGAHPVAPIVVLLTV